MRWYHLKRLISGKFVFSHIPLLKVFFRNCWVFFRGLFHEICFWVQSFQKGEITCLLFITGWRDGWDVGDFWMICEKIRKARISKGKLFHASLYVFLHKIPNFCRGKISENGECLSKNKLGKTYQLSLTDLSFVLVKYSGKYKILEFSSG